jgi:hypothetical protein
MSSALVGWKPERNKLRVAGSRVRCLHPLAVLQKAGLPVELFEPKRERQYKVVVLQKLFEDEHVQLAQRLQAQGTKVVFDLCDNYLYHSPGNRLQEKYEQQAQAVLRMLDVADVVTVSTAELARQLPCPSVVVRDGLEPVETGNRLWRGGVPAIFGNRRAKVAQRVHRTGVVWQSKFKPRTGGNARHSQRGGSSRKLAKDFRCASQLSATRENCMKKALVP